MNNVSKDRLALNDNVYTFIYLNTFTTISHFSHNYAENSVNNDFGVFFTQRYGALLEELCFLSVS